MSDKPVVSSNERSPKTQIIIIVILAILSVVLGVLYFTSEKKVEEKTENISTLEFEKLQLKNDLQEMLIQYDTITVTNERLSAEIMGQQEQIKELLKQVEKHKDDAYIIAKLKKEAGTLRDIMKGYLHTIDSLNTLNIDLRRDNESLAQELSQSKSKTKELESSKKDLEKIVATGSVLQTQNLTSEGIRVRNNGNQTSVNRANRTELIKTCTHIAENRISPKGQKTIYLRIITPDGVVLPSSDGEDSQFNFEGVSGKYSVKRQIDYKNEEMDLCIFYTVDTERGLEPGKYIVEMYEMGALIGKTDFDLK